MNEEKILTDMGYCVKEISSFYMSEDVVVIDRQNYPDKILLVELCSGEYKTFNVFGNEIVENPKCDKDELPF